jgi:hypothetical protein
MLAGVRPGMVVRLGSVVAVVTGNGLLRLKVVQLDGQPQLEIKQTSFRYSASERYPETLSLVARPGVQYLVGPYIDWVKWRDS